MGKDSRVCCKLPFFPLRVLLLGLCAWAVYTIATGLISPSISPTSFIISDVQHSDEVLVRLNLSNTTKRLTLPKDHSGKVELAIEKLSSHESKIFGSRQETSTHWKVSTSVTTVNNAKIMKNYLYLEREKVKINNLSITNYVFSEDQSVSNVTGFKPKLKNQSEAALNSQFMKHLPEILNKVPQQLKYKLGNRNARIVSLPVKWYKRPLNYSRTDRASLHSSHISDRPKDVRTILLWTPFYYGWNFVPTGSDTFSSCSERCCEVTYNRSLLSQSHAVVFHARTMSLLDLPPLRLPHQKWIFFTLEPPPLSYFPGFHFMQGMFNWTMTYRRDSDIVIPYGRVTRDAAAKHKIPTEKEWESLWKRKTRPVVWMVSHCDTYSKRELYVRKLQKYIDVDILGGCGSAVCLFNETFKCLKAFSRRYKFFLAFENSICDDYVTEKFFRALKYDMIPVVLGGADYKSLAPPGSYVDAADFPSPKALADYLYTVSVNLTLYKTYLRWKDDPFLVQDGPSHCALCEKVHSPEFELMSTYGNMVKWWVENSRCTKWTMK